MSWLRRYIHLLKQPNVVARLSGLHLVSESEAGTSREQLGRDGSAMQIMLGGGIDREIAWRATKRTH